MVWGAIIFAVLYIALSRFALPRVGEVIEERARHIAADLETAQAAKARSDEAAKQVAEATAQGARRVPGSDQRGAGRSQAGSRGADRQR